MTLEIIIPLLAIIAALVLWMRIADCKDRIKRKEDKIYFDNYQKRRDMNK